MENNTRFRIFISYSGKDIDFAREVNQILIDAGYGTIWQQRDFGNQNILSAMHEALSSDARVVGLLSPDYFESEYCMAEALGALAGDPLNKKERLIPIRIRECTPVGLLANIAFVDLTTRQPDKAELREIIPDVIRPGASQLAKTGHGLWRNPYRELFELRNRHIDCLREFSMKRLSQLAFEEVSDKAGINLHFAKRSVCRWSNETEILLPDAVLGSALNAKETPSGKTDGFVLVATAGEGKTTLVHWLLAELADTDFVERSSFIPVLADCITLSRLMSRPVIDESVITDWLGIAIAPAHPGVKLKHRENIEDFIQTLHEFKHGLFIVIDGLDELDTTGEATDRAEKLFNLFYLWAQRNNIPVSYFVTTRPAVGTLAGTIEYDVYVQAADIGNLKPVRFKPVSPDSVRELAGKRLGQGTAPVILDKFVKIFAGSHINSKFVYFLPLIHFFQNHGNPEYIEDISHLELMQEETDHIVKAIKQDIILRRKKDTSSLNAGKLAELEKRINYLLLEIALNSLTTFRGDLPRPLSLERLTNSLSVKNLQELSGIIAEQQDPGIVLKRLLHILVYDSRDALDPGNVYYRLPHNEYRDYILASELFRWINDGSDMINDYGSEFVGALAQAYLGPQRVETFLKQIIDVNLGEEGSYERHEFARKLVRRMNSELINLVPEERIEVSPHGAMLSLLISLGSLPGDIRIKAAGKCFQRAVLANGSLTHRIQLPLERDCSGASFVEADMRGCDLSGFNFTRANFDNARLNGALLSGANFEDAILRNIAMGDYKGKPTDLTGANFNGSDWFNYRFQNLKGYFHFWDLEFIRKPGSDDNIVLASGSRGKLLAFELNEKKLQATSINTLHDNEVMDLSRHPAQPILVSTSRDETVRLFHISQSPGDREPVSLQPAEVLRQEHLFESRDYPRRAQFSASGRWLAIIARDPRVLFFPVKEDGSVSILKEDGQTPTRITGNGHTGPVMCLVSTPQKLINAQSGISYDTFFTAGYDGRVAVWRENRKNTEEGWARPAGILSQPVKTGTGSVDIFRALTPGADDTGKLWAGTELDSRLYLFDFDGNTVGEAYRKDFLREGGIFSLAVNISPPRIAIGFANGGIKVFEAPASKPDEYDWRHPVLDVKTNGEIIRALTFRNHGTEVIAVTWDACLFYYNIEKGFRLKWSKLIRKYEFPESNWETRQDTGQIRFNADDNPLKKAKGISKRMKRYLNAVNSMKDR